VNGQLHAPAALPPGKEPPGTHWIRDWVDPRAGLDDLEKRKFLTLPGLQLRPPRSSSPWPVAIPTAPSRLETHVKIFKFLEQDSNPVLGIQHRENRREDIDSKWPRVDAFIHADSVIGAGSCNPSFPAVGESKYSSPSFRSQPLELFMEWTKSVGTQTGTADLIGSVAKFLCVANDYNPRHGPWCSCTDVHSPALLLEVGIAQSVKRRATSWKAWVRFSAVQDFSLSVQTESGSNSASYPMGTGDSFLGS
jgi:hypothetical protein